MATTIQISETTKNLLEQIKGKERTYDQVVRELIQFKIKEPVSMYGAFKGTKPWTKSDRPKDRYD